MRRLRILLVDDDAAFGKSMRFLLDGHDVIPKERAREALALIESGERYDAILCDLMMPDMNGIEFYNELARVSPEHLPRLIFVTGGAFTEQARVFLEANQNPYIEKPFHAEALISLLETLPV
jgi:CheY-like chemotaxis protein